jgi:splicing suppressor protein 51
MGDNMASHNTEEGGTTKPQPACNICKKTSTQVELKKCAKCKTADYCSRECQKADWKAHKKVCSQLSASQPSTTAAWDQPNLNSPPISSTSEGLSPPKGLDGPVTKPFTRLKTNTWLHDRPEKDVYRLLIDAYRMRVEDDYNYGEVDEDSIYSGASSGLYGFRRFIGLTASRIVLLPPWWSPEKQEECEQLGMNHNKSNWHDLSCAIEKSDVIEYYGDSQFPMQLRMFAEAVYQRGPGGNDGKAMMGMMAKLEEGKPNSSGNFTHMSTLDMTTMQSSLFDQ